MKIYSQYNSYGNYSLDKASITSFGSAKDISLKYIYLKRLYLLPERMQKLVSQMNKNNTEYTGTLRDLHLFVYRPLLECKSLDEARNIFPEFKEVLELNNVVKKESSNLRKIKNKMHLSDFSLYVLKERWGKLKTLNEIAQDLGLKDRSALSWFADKTRIPDLGKNYQTLLKASDEELNAVIAAKTKAYNKAHYDSVVRKNRMLSAKNKELNSYIAKEAWKRLPKIREVLSEVSAKTTGEERFAVFWSDNPEFAKMYGQMKHQVAQEIKQSKT